MKSVVVEHLEPEFEPVALIWSDQMPDDARQFKEGRFGCCEKVEFGSEFSADFAEGIGKVAAVPLVGIQRGITDRHGDGIGE